MADSTEHPAYHYMRAALDEARAAAAAGEVPVGAVIVVDNTIVARAHNEVEKESDATLHAEMLALRRASKALGRWRLDDATLYVTLEPCPMCLGALLHARVGKLCFGAWDPRQGAAGSLFNLAQHPGLPHSLEVIPEILARESEELLKSFFEACRS